MSIDEIRDTVSPRAARAVGRDPCRGALLIAVSKQASPAGAGGGDVCRRQPGFRRRPGAEAAGNGSEFRARFRRCAAAPNRGRCPDRTRRAGRMELADAIIRLDGPGWPLDPSPGSRRNEGIAAELFVQV